MPGFHTIKQSKAFSLIELMVVLGIMAILMSIAIPNFIAYRNKGFCSQAERDADHVISAIISYFSDPTRISIPHYNDLGLSLSNHVDITGVDLSLITVSVTDNTSRCPLEYQATTSGWNSNYVFTKQLK
ncbi:MAG: type II secretion system protein [Desulfobacteraceae bacterium]|nr:MAG: type II secretion system protein [Desulfobacteraceae bacterium]